MIPAAWGAPTKRAPRLGAAEGLGWSGEGRERRMSEAAPATGWERRAAASMAANGVRAFSFVLPGAFYVFTFSKGRLFFWDCHQENKILRLSTYFIETHRMKSFQITLQFVTNR